MSDDLVVERSGAVATLTLNRPESRNAIRLEMYAELPALLRGIDDDPGVKVLVVRGAGTKAFAAGADISEFGRVRADAESARSYNEHVAAAERALEGMAKPTVAMVHGHCVGGGCGLALACDLRFCDTNAGFAITPAKLGLVYSLESTRRLVDLVGPAQAKWILFSGGRLDADRALRTGLVDAVTEPDALAEHTYSFAELVATRAQYSVRAAKQIVNRIVAGQLHDDAETTELRNSSFDTDDYAEGVRAFLEKRPPRFTWS
ncbi:enoyl-CoA hydratase-related protein [Streptomonospora nanhaiensis]|uniref:Enoyl-CoA hydratase/carnithine racemase n=1 Tax=Streptomonospora nanhaiensis TaxID=1323731 RepID=A0A853BVF7_9ACTN|nr:enoyl-CoA hydratase-related protein [Streptomonospora nanhaiensis]MBV2365401.1 enoyl-CoA hydratase/isomerase family protein [Streptomonospora nanhaiensis]MBX9390202.1 enoyl-CoA hydratase/isomerase family protein [Streptomonospora nanhaiensis]NYI99004.1 enoyl-CoA hydratase/carnithine racemase [Streptomonospora nanhaiensis]